MKTKSFASFFRYRFRYFAISIGLLVLFLSCALAPAQPARTQTPPNAAVVATQPAWMDEAVIYEVFVTNFSEAGTFRAIIPRLPELKELGVNTLWLMPIHPIGVTERKGTLGSPYAVQNYYEVNPNYGTPADFQALVDAVHQQGMHIIIDLVANHTAWDNPWVVAHPDWYTKGMNGKISQPEGTDWTDVADLNYDNPQLWQEMQKVMRYWVEKFDIDGYRCDVAEWVPLGFWKDAITQLRSIKPVLMLAEGADSELHDAGFNLTYGWPFYSKLKEVWKGAAVADLVSLLQQEKADPNLHRLRFTTNHDETAWDAPPEVVFQGESGSKAAFAIALSIPGVPLLYNGQEVGINENVIFFEKNPINWSKNPQLQSFYDQMLALYNSSDALRSGAVNYLLPSAKDILLVERQGDDPSERLIIAVNVRNQKATIDLPPSLQTVAFTDILTGQTIALGKSSKLELPPYGYTFLQVK